jgi:hypothetical protein
VGKLFHVRKARAKFPVRASDFVGETRSRDALAKVNENWFGNVYLKWMNWHLPSVKNFAMSDFFSSFVRSIFFPCTST